YILQKDNEVIEYFNKIKNYIVSNSTILSNVQLIYLYNILSNSYYNLNDYENSLLYANYILNIYKTDMKNLTEICNTNVKLRSKIIDSLLKIDELTNNDDENNKLFIFKLLLNLNKLYGINHSLYANTIIDISSKLNKFKNKISNNFQTLNNLCKT